MNRGFRKLRSYLAIVRDIGIILGLPLVIGVGIQLYERQIAALKAENEALKLLNYSSALTQIKSQKELLEEQTLFFEMEKDRLMQRISKLQQEESLNQNELDHVRQELATVNTLLEDDAYLASRGLMAITKFYIHLMVGAVELAGEQIRDSAGTERPFRSTSLPPTAESANE